MSDEFPTAFGLRAYPGWGGGGRRVARQRALLSRGCGWKRPRLPCFDEKHLERRHLPARPAPVSCAFPRQVSKFRVSSFKFREFGTPKARS